MTVELTVVVPTYNERDNILPLLDRLEKTLRGISWEVIFVDDDSTDCTAGLVRRIASGNRQVRCLQRIGRRGLSSACIEGILASSAPYVAVMDADMQHDETLLPAMLETLKAEDVDVVIGTRYADGGNIQDWDRFRARISRLATLLSRFVITAKVSDPLSGFIMLRREFFDKTVHGMSGKGFKILLDLFASASREVRFKELPYRFRPRHAGVSKLDTFVAWEYALLILDKIIGHLVPVQFVMFVSVGAIGALAHVTVLGVFLKPMHLSFFVSQSSATVVAMTMNFILNNLFTYRDRRLRGWGFVRGLVLFYIACSIGAFANIRVAEFLFDRDVPWWLAGLLGAIVGAVWNYAITSTFTWTARTRRPG